MNRYTKRVNKIQNTAQVSELSAERVALINRRRRQILVHSCIYYRFNTSIIDDNTFDRWAGELAELQRKYPQEAEEGVYADVFKQFDGSTGFDLPYYLPEIVRKAEQLLDYMK